jgi:hypothetical protein
MTNINFVFIYVPTNFNKNVLYIIILCYILKICDGR